MRTIADRLLGQVITADYNRFITLNHLAVNAAKTGNVIEAKRLQRKAEAAKKKWKALASNRIGIKKRNPRARISRKSVQEEALGKALFLFISISQFSQKSTTTWE